MKVIKEGHLYEADNFEYPESPGQTIQFIEKIPTGNGTELTTINDGTTNEELLKILINRLYFLNNKFSCKENDMAIMKLEESLMWLEKRTRDREARNVEGKHTK